MAGENPLTPEKQLLKLIEKPMATGSLHAAAIKYHGLSLFSFAALKGRLSFLKNRFKVDFKRGGINRLDINALNQVLKLCVFILVSYFVLHLTTSIMHLKKDLNLKMRIEKTSEVRPSQISSFLKSLSYYLEKARERDIFNMAIKRTTYGAAFAKGPSQRVIEISQNLKLVGISWSDDPDVMIEDTKTQRTLFLKKGQMIDNEIRLKAVFKDKVILSYGEEEIELR
jgi:hypothetical protein